MSVAPNMQVLIIGGGIGGLALAQGLKKAGIGFSVYERDGAPTSREQGYRLHIDAYGSHALHDLLPDALWQTFYATAGDPGDGLAFLTEKLEMMLLVEDEVTTTDRSHVATLHHAASRLTLRQVLLAGLGDDVHFGKEFVRYEQSDESVRAYFADGTTAEGDLLIGADGANSKVRRQLLPDAKRKQTNAVGVGGKFDLNEDSSLSLPNRLQNGMNIVLGPKDFLFTSVFRRRQQPEDAILRLGEKLKSLGVDPNLLIHSLEDRDYILWAFVTQDVKDLFTSSGTDLKEMVCNALSKWHPDLLRMIDETDASTVNAFSFLTSSRVSHWETSRVTLMGDSIHSMTPVGGLGANTALRDARLLRRQLVGVHRGEQPLLTAVSKYERSMLGYGFSAVKDSLRNTHHAIEGPWARRLTKLFFRICRVIPPLKRAAFGNGRTLDL